MAADDEVDKAKLAHVVAEVPEGSAVVAGTAGATIVTEFAGSALVLSGVYRWSAPSGSRDSRSSPRLSPIVFGRSRSPIGSWSRTPSSSIWGSPVDSCCSPGTICGNAIRN